MKEIDFHKLDGQILRTFLVTLEESSVSRAADRLDLTQSAVSHSLAKLRRILGDPLFVRSGQGLTPTETALSLKAPVLEVLDRLKALTDQREFDPRTEAMHFVVAANDIQRDLVFPDLFRRTRAAGINLSLEIKPSGVPSVSTLRDAQCDLILTPLPPDAPDMFQTRLLTGEMRCFYDSSQTEPPGTIDAYLEAQHIDVQFVLGGYSSDVLSASALPYVPKPTVTVSNFAAITPFVLDTKLISTEVEFLFESSLRRLAMAPLPFATDPLNIYMVWHERSNNDPSHKWLRTEVKQIASDIERRNQAA